MHFDVSGSQVKRVSSYKDSCSEALIDQLTNRKEFDHFATNKTNERRGMGEGWEVRLGIRL